MNKKLEIKLVEDFPKAFSEYGKPPNESCMAFGCACDDGWEPLIRKVCKNLSPDAKLAQVKEKFGRLRIYLQYGTLEDDDLCWEAELASAKICEFCGEPGKEISGSWIKTLCPQCAKNRKKRI